MVEQFTPTQRNGSGYTRIDDGYSPVGDGFPEELLKHFGDEIQKIAMDISQRTC